MISSRYANLNKKCADQMGLLEDAYKKAKEYSDKLGPAEEWLGGAEKKVKEMETVPTEEDQIQKRIKELDKLHQEILDKQPSFVDLADVATTLMQWVGDEDSKMLADKIKKLNKRYLALIMNSDTSKKGEPSGKAKIRDSKGKAV